jgi:hypothetical protein
MPKIDLSSISKKNNPVIQSDSLKTRPKKITKNVKAIKQQNISSITKSLKEKKIKIEPEDKISVKLTDLERAKKIKLLELYQIEFPDELQKYSSIKFAKCSDEELIKYNELFQKNVSFTNNLDWGVSISQQALQLYETLDKMGGLEINGISKLGGTPEWKKSVKTVLMKHMDAGVTFYEPENQLIFLIIKESLTYTC